MNNKRIGMAINYDYPDYGGMLQAYASFRKIRDLGYEPEAINIDAVYGSIKRRKIKYFSKKIFDPSIVKEKGRIISKKLRIKLNCKLKQNFKERYGAFESFCATHFKTSIEYQSWEEMSEGCKSYVAVVVGSDQLWLPSNIAGDYYTLSFVPEEVKKIAYATSFGVSEIPKDQTEKTRSFLTRIEYLSAREKTGQQIIKNLTSREVPLVCDPALLLTAEEWDEEIEKERIIKEPYIFCYFMGDNLWQREFVKKLKEKTGCKIVALLHLDQYIKSDENYVDYAPYDITPDDFINLIKYSDYVCTDSFHGSVFSIIYHKKFFTFIRFNKRATLSTNSRIDTLLGNFNLKSRLVSEEYSINKLLDYDIDYELVDKSVEKLRDFSLEYLTNALKK